MGNTLEKVKARNKQKLKIKRKQVPDKEYIDYLVNLIKEITGVNPFENTRRAEVIEVRSLLVYILRDVQYLTYYGIRDYFESMGRNMDHSTALYSYNNYPIYEKYNKKLKYWFDLLMDSSNIAAAKKIQAKTIIDNSDASVADLFIYMVKKNKNEGTT